MTEEVPQSKELEKSEEVHSPVRDIAESEPVKNTEGEEEESSQNTGNPQRGKRQMSDICRKKRKHKKKLVHRDPEEIKEFRA